MNSWNSTAHISCKNHSGLHIYYSQLVKVTNLEFIGCGGNQFTNVNGLIIENTVFKGLNMSKTSLELIQTATMIVQSSFVSNKRGKRDAYVERDFNLNFGPVSVGGAIVAIHSVINITQSVFDSNQAQYGGAIIAERNSIVNLDSVTFTNNFALYGGALYSSSSTVTARGCIFINNTATYGGAINFFNKKCHYT